MTARSVLLQRWGGSALSLLLLLVGAYVVYRLLGEHSLAEIADSVRQKPRGTLALAAAFAAASWTALTLYDTLAFRLVHVALPWRQIARDAFTSYALSLNIGASAVSGSALRLRLYQRHGLGANEVTRIVAYNITTMWIGYCVLAGVVLVAVPLPLPASLELTRTGVRIIGAVALCIAGLYLLLAWRRRRPLRIRSWQYPLPPLRWALAQIGVSVAHWSLAAAAIHVLMPQGTVTYLQVLGLLLLEALVGLVTHVPGGLGVLETVFVLGLRDVAPEAEVLGGILAFRVVFYWLALLVGILLYADHEIFRTRRRARRAARG